MKRLLSLVALAAVVGAGTAPAFAGANLLQNSEFATVSGGAVGQTEGQLGFDNGGANPFLPTDWTTAAPDDSYFFLFNSAASAQAGVDSQYGSSNVGLYGVTTNPNGGNFVGADPAYHNNYGLSQTVSGLTVGGEYQVSFSYAAAQQTGFSGPTNSGWNVTLGSQTDSTLLLENTSQGFNGWYNAVLDFTATAAAETLTFQAYCSTSDPISGAGCSGGVPPFALLDSPVLSAAPEPSTWAMMGLGFAGLAFAGYRRRRKAPAVG